MSYTRVKICGITTPEDAVMVAEAGADAIGLNFVGGPRKLGLDQARAILHAIDCETDAEPIPRADAGPTPVALCFAPSADTFKELWPTQIVLPVSRFQVYGADTQGLLRDLDGNCWPVVRVATRDDLFGTDFNPIGNIHLTVGWRPRAVVLDAAAPGQLGGTGKPINWEWVAELRSQWPRLKIILAGGLTPDNVAEAIRIARPYAVDVGSGVEFPGQPGKKDPARVKAFIAAVRGA